MANPGRPQPQPPVETGPSAEQPPLIDLYQQTGELAVRNLAPQTEAARDVARDVLQLEVLSLFGKLNQKDKLLREQSRLDRYGKGKPIVRERIEKQRDAMTKRAEDAFYDSVERDEGVARITAIGNNPDDFLTETERAWNRFKAQYKSPRNRKQRERFARELRADIKQQQSDDNRAHGKRPHLLDKHLKPGQPKLNTRERLEAIEADPRAGFLPTTHREKNMVISWLDYLDNPRYPLRVTNQLLEVFNHQERQDYSGSEAVTSIVFEAHDYGTNAAQTLAQLQELEEFIDECPNPNVTLLEEAADHPGIAPLIRYRDIHRFLHDRVLPAHGNDLLLTKEDRRPHQVPNKNKTVEDIYTRLRPSEAMEDYLEAAADGLLIKDIRSLVRAAVADQEARVQFWRDRMTELSEAPDWSSNPIRRQAGSLLVRARITPVE